MFGNPGGTAMGWAFVPVYQIAFVKVVTSVVVPFQALFFFF